MNVVVRLVVLLLLAAMIASCGTKRTRATKPSTSGSSCVAPVVGPCPSCSISCAIGKPASCLPGEATGPTCTTPPACKCGD